MYIAKDIKEKINQYMNRNNLYITDFCDMCWISRPTYYKLIRWKHKRFKDKVIDWLKKIGILD